MAAEKEYRRLAGAQQLGWTRSSLWLGRDHLLKVTNVSGYVQEYRRFYFKDIQALIVQRSNRGLSFSIILLSLILILIFIAADHYFRSGLQFAIIALPAPIALLAINWLRGPSCKFYVRTAVQTDRVEAVRRVRKAERIIAQLRPLILQAQGEWPAPSSSPAASEAIESVSAVDNTLEAPPAEVSPVLPDRPAEPAQPGAPLSQQES